MKKKKRKEQHTRKCIFTFGLTFSNREKKKRLEGDE